MTFEEQLTAAFDTLTERLRGEIHQHVQRTTAELMAASPYERDPAVIAAARQELELAVATARQTAHEEGVAAGTESGLAVGRDAGFAAGKEEGFVAGKEEGFAAGREEGFAAGREEGFAAGREQGSAAGKEEGFVSGRDQGFAAGIDEGFASGRDQGFAAGRDEGHASGREVGKAEALREAAERVTPPDDGIDRLADAMRAIDAARSLSEVLDTLVTVAGEDASGVGVWLLRGGQLHRWQAAQTAGSQPLTVRSLEAGGPHAAAVANNTTARDESTLAVPMALEGQVVAVFAANLEGDSGRRAPRTENLEVLVRYAARSLEALTAFATARALTQLAAPDARHAPQIAADDPASEEDTSARRYARLLVSEIRLYHEAAVVEGRRDRDLATRLGGEIARARVMYEQRVPSHVRERADYFHDELVRTLADGDDSLLEVRRQKLEVRN